MYVATTFHRCDNSNTHTHTQIHHTYVCARALHNITMCGPACKHTCDYRRLTHKAATIIRSKAVERIDPAWVGGKMKKRGKGGEGKENGADEEYIGTRREMKRTMHFRSSLIVVRNFLEFARRGTKSSRNQGSSFSFDLAVENSHRRNLIYNFLDFSLTMTRNVWTSGVIRKLARRWQWVNLQDDFETFQKFSPRLETCKDSTTYPDWRFARDFQRLSRSMYLIFNIYKNSENYHGLKRFPRFNLS